MAGTENMLSAYGSLIDVGASENAAIRDNALETAKLARGRGSVYLAGQAGGMLMSNLAEMAGMKTGAQEKQETIEGILNSNRSLDPNDPKSLYTLGQQFMDAGLTGIGQKFLERGRELDLETYKADTDRINALSSGSSTDPGTFRKSLNTAALILGCDLENDADCRQEAFKLVKEYKRENIWEGESTKALVDEMILIHTEGASAGGEIAKFNQMLTILPEIYTGWAAGAWQTANRVGAMFGLPASTKAAGQMEMFAQGGMEMALKYIQQTKGAVSDREFEAFLASAPGLTRTQAGNQLMLETAMKYAEYNQNKTAELTKWIAEERAAGRAPLLEGWSAHLIEWSNKEENIIKLPTEVDIEKAISAPSSTESSEIQAESVDEMALEIERISNLK